MRAPNILCLSPRCGALVALTGLSAALIGCGGSGSSGSSAALPFGPGVPHAYEERFLATHPDATLDLRHTIIFRLENAPEDDDTGDVGTDVAPYRIAHRTDLTLSRDPTTGTAPTLRLIDRHGVTLATVGEEDTAVSVTVPPGRYTLELERSSGAPDDVQTIFLHPLMFVPGADANDVALLKADESCVSCDFTGLTWSSGTVNQIDLENSDFSDSDLGAIVFNNTLLGYCNFTGAILSAVAFNKVLLENAILDNATIGTTSSPSPPMEATLLSTSLRGTKFVNATVDPITLAPSAIFDGASFIGTCFNPSNLAGASFAGTTFDAGSGICNANFTGADLTSATFTGTAATECHCGASTDPPVLTGASLSNGITGAAFVGVDLTGLNLPAGVVPQRDLSHVSFAGSTLRGAILSGNVLDMADLSGAVLDDADLSSASLNGTTLSGASLVGADLAQADGQSTDFSGTDLTGAVLFQTTFGFGYFPDALLTDADLRQANLTFAQFYGDKARIDGALLAQSNWTTAILGNVDFSRVNAAGAIFSGAQLVNCTFDAADLSTADFESTYLQGTSFNGTVVDGTDFTNAAFSAVGCAVCEPGETCNAPVPCWTYENSAGQAYTVTFGASDIGSVATDVAGEICPDGATGPCNSAASLIAAMPPQPSIPPCQPSGSNWCAINARGGAANAPGAAP